MPSVPCFPHCFFGQSGGAGHTPGWGNIKDRKMIMKTERKDGKVSRSKAVEIVMNLKGISYGLATRYTDPELKECLRQAKLKADF